MPMTRRPRKQEKEAGVKRDKLGRYVKGSVPYMKDKNHSEKTKKRWSKIRKGSISWIKGKRKEDYPQLANNSPSAFQKGQIPWNRNLRKETDERVAKVSKALKGKPKSAQAVENMKQAQRKRFLKNPKGPFTDKCHSLKAKKEMSVSQLERFKHEPGTMKGKHQTEESKEKSRLSHLGYCPTAEAVRKSLTRHTPTSLEEKFQGIVDKFGLPYKFTGDGSFILGRCNPDFINTNSEKIAVEVYARYYKERDDRNILRWKHIRRQKFAKFGWKILFFDETQVREEYVVPKLEGKIRGS